MSVFDPSVYQHHRNGTRDGLYIDPVFTQTAAATTHVLTGFMGTVTTTVYAQPLYVENGPGGAEVFVVATEDNHVTTYDATTGAVVWDVGPSIIGPFATKNPPGGSVGPKNIGITGTPYIDIGSRTIFFDAMVTPDSNATYHHTVFGISLDTGAVRTGWPVDVSAKVTGFDSASRTSAARCSSWTASSTFRTAGTTGTAATTSAPWSASRSPRRRRRPGGTRRRPRAASGVRARCRPTAPPSSP